VALAVVRRSLLPRDLDFDPDWFKIYCHDARTISALFENFMKIAATVAGSDVTRI